MKFPIWADFVLGFSIPLVLAIVYGIVKGVRAIKRRRAEAEEDPNLRLLYYLSNDEQAFSELPSSGRDRRQSLRGDLHRLEERFPVLRGFGRELADADIYLYPYEWLALVALAAGAVCAALTYVFGSLLFGIAVGLLCSYVGSGVIIRYRQRARLRAFDARLADALTMLAGALQSGFSFEQAMNSVAQDGLPPLQGEFQRYTREIALGVSTESALVNLLVRNPSFDLRLAVNAIQIHRQVGGNLSSVLEQIADTIRERVKLRQEVRVLTAQARLSGYIVAFIPVALVFILNMLNPQYMHNMLTHALGIAILATCAAMIGIASVIIQRIVDITL